MGSTDMTDSGHRYFAPVAQGLGDGSSYSNAADAANRLTIEAGLRAAAVSNPLVQAPDTEDRSDIKIQCRWRTDLGSYARTTAYAPNAAHGGIAVDAKLRHIAVDASDEYVETQVTVDYSDVFAQLAAWYAALPRISGNIDWNTATSFFVDYSTAYTSVGKANAAQLVGSRSADPRAEDQRHLMLNTRSVTGYTKTVDLQVSGVAVPPGCAMNAFTGEVVNLGFGPWVTGNSFELGTGTYDFVEWQGFAWKQFLYILNTTSSTWKPVSYKISDCFGENIKSLQRFTEGDPTGIEVDGFQCEGWSQSLARIDVGKFFWKNMYCDAQFILGDPICGSIWYGSNETFSTGRVEDSIFKNMWDMPLTADGYIQGDGTGGNRGGYNQEWERVVIDTCGDGGCDSKGFALDPNKPVG